MRKALIVGVQNYTRGYSSSIGPAVAGDLGAMRDVLTQLNVAITRVLGENADEVVTSTDIKSAVAEFLVDAKADDELIMYFSGHGAQFEGISYMVPSDANPRLPDPSSYLVPVKFELELAECRARGVTFILDACRNGPYSGEPSAPLPASIMVAYMFATEPSDTAGVTGGAGPVSAFTKALAEILPMLSPGIRLDRAQERIQARLNEVCDFEGISRQTFDVVANVDKDRVPFPLFQAMSPASSRDSWSRILRPLMPTLMGPFDQDLHFSHKHFTDLLVRADRIEHEASRVSGRGASVQTPWLEPHLPGRLANALSMTCPGVGKSEFERMLLIGITVAVEAAFRSAELNMLDNALESHSFSILLASEPSLHGLLQPQEADAETLRHWIVHLSSVRETVLGRAGGLAEKVRDITQSLLPDSTLPEFSHASSYISSCIRVAFDTGQSTEELEPVRQIDCGTGIVAIHGHRLAALLRLTWLLALDTRIFPVQTGIDLLAEDEPVAEAIDLLQHAKWFRSDGLVDLHFWNRSAALDFALRHVVTEINEELLRHRQQVDGALYGTAIPLAAAASRLIAEDQAFRLPHIKFEVSAAETQSLLMGTNLYHDSTLAIRELYQNAVDACHYRAARVRGVQSAEDDNSWSPSVWFRLGEEGGRKYVECQDNGVGMSTHELREAFAKVGRRFRDLPEYVEEVADWASRGITPFEPISQFGIGVLSYFMLADKIGLRTARVDRNLAIRTPLKVSIRGGHSLFRIQEADTQHPAGGGTIVRLYLRPDKKEFDLETVLARIVRCPTVPVHYGPVTWNAGCLYSPEGGLKNVIFAASDLGIYLHNGRGEILINGIPTEDSDPMPLFGCTITIGGWAKPNLSIDRRSLLSLDRDVVSERIRAAAERLDPATPIDANWLIEFYANDIRAANVIYQKFREASIPLYAAPEEHGEDGAESGIKALNLVLSSQGVYAGDPELARHRWTNTVLGSARSAQLYGQPDVVNSHPPGLPPFNQHLLALMTSRSFSDSRQSRRRMGYSREAESANLVLRVDRPIDEIMDLAESYGVILGSAAAYAWAVSFLERPQALLLTSAAARWSAEGVPQIWERLLNSSCRKVTALGRNSYSARLFLLRAAVALDPALQLGLDASSVAIPSLNDLPADTVVALKKWVAVRAETYGNNRWGVDSDSASRTEWNHIQSIISGGASVAEDSRAVTYASAALSRAGLLAVSYDLDGVAPFRTGQIPLMSIMFAADEFKVSPRELSDNLLSAGYEVNVPPQWDELDHLRTEFPFLLTDYSSFNLFRREPFMRLASLKSIVDLGRTVGWERLKAGIEVLASSSVADGYLKKLDSLNFENPEILQRHAATFQRDFSVWDINVTTLVACAVGCEFTYGEALDSLLQYKGIARSWKLPDSLDYQLQGARPPAGLNDLFSATVAVSGDMTGTKWLLLGMRASAIGGETLPSIAEAAAPILTAVGEDASQLLELASLIPRAVTFDDLLIVGCLQMLPAGTPKAELAAMSRPFAVDLSALEERAGALSQATDLKWREDGLDALRISERPGS